MSEPHEDDLLEDEAGEIDPIEFALRRDATLEDVDLILEMIERYGAEEVLDLIEREAA